MAENLVEVGGELINVTGDGTVVNALYVKDKSRNKSQKEINDSIEARVGYYVCDTAADVAEKAIAATGYVLTTGGSIKVLMQNANTANNATLNINSTGAKALYYDGERASADNSWEEEETLEVYYDGESYYANNVVGRSIVDSHDTTNADLDFSDELDNVVMRLANGHIKTKNFDSSKNAISESEVAKVATIEEGAQVNDVITDDLEGVDLNISDEEGNVLIQAKDGHIRTKNFDSSAIKKGNLDKTLQDELEQLSINDVELVGVDLDFSDEQDNVVMRVANGHIKTKNFDSSNINHYANRPIDGYEVFLVEVNNAVENNDSTATIIQDSVDIRQDRGIILLPTNYSVDGKPVRLVIASPGSSGRITSSTSTLSHIVPHTETMLAEGYAVMAVNGTPGYTDGIPTYGGMCTPGFLKSVQVAYKYVTDKYNIRKDGVLLTGYSQGTAEVWQIAANKILPVKAMTLFGPCVDIWKLMYAYPGNNTRITTLDGREIGMREWMCEQFGFVEKTANRYVLDIFNNLYNQGDIVTKPTTFSNGGTVPTDAEFAYILNNYEKWLGYDPICWGTSKDIVGEQFRYRNWVTVQDPNEDLCFNDVANTIPCPMKMFVGTEDVLTTPKIVNWYKMMADNAGMMCHVRTYQGGNHNYRNKYPEIQVQTKYSGTITTNVPSWEGMLFLERYD